MNDETIKALADALALGFEVCEENSVKAMRAEQLVSALGGTAPVVFLPANEIAIYLVALILAQR